MDLKELLVKERETKILCWLPAFRQPAVVLRTTDETFAQTRSVALCTVMRWVHASLFTFQTVVAGITVLQVSAVLVGLFTVCCLQKTYLPILLCKSSEKENADIGGGIYSHSSMLMLFFCWVCAMLFTQPVSSMYHRDECLHAYQRI